MTCSLVTPSLTIRPYIISSKNFSTFSNSTASFLYRSGAPEPLIKAKSPALTVLHAAMTVIAKSCGGLEAESAVIMAPIINLFG